jgi:hypothetical protein
MMDSLHEVGEGAVSEVGNIGYTLLEPCDLLVWIRYRKRRRPPRPR